MNINCVYLVKIYIKTDEKYVHSVSGHPLDYRIEKTKNRTPLGLIRELDFSLLKRKKDKQMYLKIFTL